MDSRVATALNLHVIALLGACLFIEPGGGKATAYGTNHGMPGHQFPRFQKNFWYEYSTPPSTSFPEYIDYHLSPEPVTQIPPNSPHLLNPAGMENITAQLGAPARLSCLVKNLQDKTVSWLKRNDDVPILVTFGNSVYIHDVRITVERNRYREGKQEWVLNILNAQKSDQGIYECQISTEPPQIHKVHLYVEAPILTVMDGFGRELVDQYYKVGSSLEVMCTVDRLPARPLPQIIEWRHGNRRLAQENSTLGQIIHTELQGDGAISHLSITQASVKHSGIYTCSLSDTISQSLRLHIIDGKYDCLDATNVLYKDLVATKWKIRCLTPSEL
ncbi:zwei Ig domain protein zig-8-like [Tigriopus californicus]|uniref:zwei Ig domain protein zig-8-like n=1 Tax=Tigriopus californicus TaxID=6832 RepID=UPI0027D9E5AC|nr:zwei Ig domain protein zig-8-like [Tigriopus californicus]